MNPKDWTLLQWIGVVLVINGALTGYVNEMTDLVGAVWAKHIVSLCTIGSGICGGLVTMFGGIGTQARNVVSAGGQINVSPHAADALTALAQDSTQPAVRVVANLLIAAFAISLVFLAGLPGAEAQTGRRAVPVADPFKDVGDKIKQDLSGQKQDGAPATGRKIGDSGCTATGDAIVDLQCVLKAGGAKLVIHLKQAYALSIAADPKGNKVDETSSTCTKALVPIVQLVSAGPKPGTVPADDPMALTADEQSAASAPDAKDSPIVIMEKIRILRLTLDSPTLNQACGALVQDEVKNAQNIIGKVTTLVTGAGLAGVTGIPGL